MGAQGRSEEKLALERGQEEARAVEEQGAQELSAVEKEEQADVAGALRLTHEAAGAERGEGAEEIRGKEVGKLKN